MRIGRAAFLEPLTTTVPRSRRPPSMTNLSIGGLYHLGAARGVRRAQGSAASWCRIASFGDIAHNALGPLGVIPHGEKPAKPRRPYRPRDPLKSLFRHVIEREIGRVYDLWDRFENVLGPWKIR